MKNLSNGREALRDDPNNGSLGGEALRDDPNNGCGGDYHTYIIDIIDMHSTQFSYHYYYTLNSLSLF